MGVMTLRLSLVSNKSGQNQDLYYAYFKDAGLYIFAQEKAFINDLKLSLEIKEIKDREVGRLILREKGNIFIQKLFVQQTTQFISDKDKVLSICEKWEKISGGKKANPIAKNIINTITTEIRTKLK